jgi:DNA-binding LytR/AlgR family response regulator
MTASRRNLHLNWWEYFLWSLSEVIVFSAFAALYMALVYGNYGYFPALGRCLCISFAILPYPYLFFSVLIALIRPDKMQEAEDDLVRFADNTGRLKLVIANDVILYILAQENYVSIHYMEGEKEKEYSLRQSMRGIEELMSKHGIVRCQRSYFVNPRHVTVLRKDKEGMIQAELDVNGSRPVPVSPKYYEDLNKML